MSTIDSNSLLADIQSCFAPSDSESRIIGAELELIPSFRTSGARVPAQSAEVSSAAFIRRVAAESGWTEESLGRDPPYWTFGAGSLTFEPGGQIELASAPYESASGLIEALHGAVKKLRAAADKFDIELNAIGIEPKLPISSVPLQLRRDRYSRMTDYFSSLGPWGVVMMRQTASIQINVDRGKKPRDRWRLLNALAPCLSAIFANSPLYEGKSTGHRSFRAHVWRSLDSDRTGIPLSTDEPERRYLEFALNARVMLSGETDYPTFRELLGRGKATMEIWRAHLTTLFPEIRPRDYFEIRSIDSIDVDKIPAAIALIAGIVYDSESSAAAMSLFADPDLASLVTAGSDGLDNSAILETSIALADLALRGCRRLGDSYISFNHFVLAADFFDRYTRKGLSPCDDLASP